MHHMLVYSKTLLLLLLLLLLPLLPLQPLLQPSVLRDACRSCNTLANRASLFDGRLLQ